MRTHCDVPLHTDSRQSLRTFVRQACWFVLIGTLSTGLTSLIYLALRSWFVPIPANVISVALSTAISSEANRLLTFTGIATTRLRLDLQSLLVFLFYCFYNTLVLAALSLVVTHAGSQIEATTLFLASGLAGIGRFLLLRQWVFNKQRARHTDP